MKKCPRCGLNTLRPEKVMNALSRRDNKTYICSDCGTAEAMEDYAAKMGLGGMPIFQITL